MNAELQEFVALRIVPSYSNSSLNTVHLPRFVAFCMRQGQEAPVVSRVFRTFDLPSYSGRLLGLGCFAPGPHGGQEQSD